MSRLSNRMRRLSLFNKEKHISGIGEVHIEGWVNPAYNYNLIKKRNFLETGRRHMYLLFGSGDQKNAHLVRAALIMTTAEKEQFVEKTHEYISGLTGDERGVNFTFNGFGKTSVDFSSLANDAIKEQNLKKAPNFIFIKPFFNGRKAALTPHGAPQGTRLSIWTFALCVALFGVAKLIFKRGTSGPSKKKRALAAQQSIQAMAHSGAAAVAHGSMKNSEVDYDLINGNYTKEQSAMLNRAMGQSGGGGQNVDQDTRRAAVANGANEKAPAERTLANSVADNSPLGRMHTKAKLESQRQSVNQFEIPKRKEKLAYSDGPIKSAKAGLFSRKRKRDASDPFARIAAERNSY